MSRTLADFAQADHAEHDRISNDMFAVVEKTGIRLLSLP